MLIDQRANFAADFGHVFRSSATFYVRQSATFRTTLSLLNYWQLKRGITVAVVASARDMAGKLLRRERLSFDAGMVINYVPDVAEGSCEIEAFSNENLVIPYAAVTALYESERGVSAVHSYARSYSAHEIEEGRTICESAEACWTLRDAPGVRSFAVIHNGPKRVPEQVARLHITGGGMHGNVSVKLPELAPYQSVKVVPQDEHPDLVRLLDGKPGHASLRFQLGNAFTRMLIGHESSDDFQVTHSNFDYSVHETDRLGPEHYGVMRVPSCGLRGKSVLVYPESDPGTYEIRENGRFFAKPHSGQALAYPIDSGTLMFSKVEERALLPFPSRLVTAIAGNHDGPRLPFECSLGVLTKAQPPKRFWWGMCQANSSLVVHDVPEIYGPFPRAMPGAAIRVKLYSATRTDALEIVLDAADMQPLDLTLPIAQLFGADALADLLAGEPGYWVVTSDYPGLTCYTLLRNEHGSMCLEHGF